LEPGAVVCLFTDGLLELDHRRAPDEAASELMRAVKLLDPTESADLNCSRLLADFVGSAVNQDDIALLLIRRTDGAASFVD
jgi:serine phosphatase RsbU (regulator of sigma subunit)